LASGLEGATGSGSTIGPDGALYVTEGAAGRISRVDPQTGAITTFASGLPAAIPAVGLGGPMDVAFIDDTAYALVTLVGPDVGGTDAVGIYRVDGADSFTVVADIGESRRQSADPCFRSPHRGQYVLEPSVAVLVTDRHLPTCCGSRSTGDHQLTRSAILSDRWRLKNRIHGRSRSCPPRAGGKIVTFGFGRRRHGVARHRSLWTWSLASVVRSMPPPGRAGGGVAFSCAPDTGSPCR
jgi:hypothetical protein